MFKLFSVFFLAFLPASSARAENIPTTTLSNGQEFPLVGLGVGNLQHELIESQISNGIGEGMKYRLIDTAHASHNEKLIFDGVRQGLSSSDTKGANIHVITKVWYTHLGYERTKLSVRESLEQLNSPDISVHIMIHWPRCRDDIPWMNCESEEELLPDYVKEAGPPPHLDKDNAFKESWRALEDIYLGEVSLGKNMPSIASIGVSNFDLADLKALIPGSRVVPHMMQGNVWSYIFEPRLLLYCFQMNIHFQAYNVMNGIFYRYDAAPLAFTSLQDIGRDLSDGSGHEYTPAQVLLKWLVQNNISVIPRTRDHGHLQENSAVSLASMPNLSSVQEEKVVTAVRALFEGKDLIQPQAAFLNGIEDGIVHLFWKDRDGEEVPVQTDLSPGETFRTYTHTGHVFVVYDDTQTQRREFEIKADYGQVEQIHIEELFDEL